MKILENKQNTDAWFSDRLGKVTGSKLKNIVVKRGTNKKIGFYELIADRLATEEPEEDPRERGHRLEDVAIAEFEKLTKKKVKQVGLCISDENENIALSPDGLIGKNNEEAVEVKCLNSAKHLQTYFEQEIPSEYHEQAMQYFIVNEKLKKLYFVMFDPRITVKPIHWIEIKREDVKDEIEFLRDYQTQVLEEVEALITNLTF